MYRGKNYLTKNPDTKRVDVDCDLYLESLEKTTYENEDQLLENGFTYIDWENSCNFEWYTEKTRDLSYTMNWNLYWRKNPRGRGFQYVVEIRKHLGGDVRCNYKTLWYYKTNENCHYYLLWLMDCLKGCDYWQGRYLKDCLRHHRENVEDFKKEA